MGSHRPDLLARFIDHLESSRLIQPGQHILVAVSGGRDSMCLLHLLVDLPDSWSLELTVGHVNHRIRKTSDNDQQMVEESCDKLGLRYLIRTLDGSTKKPGESPEAWGRQHRYAALEDMRNEVKAELIASAHQANDQVETILMRLAIGSGLMSLRSIYPKVKRIVRPLLPFSRREIDSFVRQRGIDYIEDETNNDLTIPRNFIRHKVICEWEKFNPNLTQAFNYASEYAAEAEAAVKFALNQISPTIVSQQEQKLFHISVSDLSTLPILLRILVIRNVIGEDEKHWRRHQWEQLKSFIRRAQTGHILSLPNGWLLLLDRSNWVLKQSESHPEKPIEIQVGQITDCDDFLFTWNWISDVIKLGNNPWSEVIDGEAVRNKTIILRSWTAGDVFIPLGMKQRKKVSDFLTDVKMDRFTKEQQLVLTADNEIIWLCGQRISEYVKITPKTTQFAELSIRPKVG